MNRSHAVYCALARVLIVIMIIIIQPCIVAVTIIIFFNWLNLISSPTLCFETRALEQTVKGIMYILVPMTVTHGFMYL